jgi:hypothetical protein
MYLQLQAIKNPDSVGLNSLTYTQTQDTNTRIKWHFVAKL